MGEHVLAAVRTGPGKTEFREFPMPKISDDGALLKVEVAGICGTDVKQYAAPAIGSPPRRSGVRWCAIEGSNL